MLFEVLQADVCHFQHYRYPFPTVRSVVELGMLVWGMITDELFGKCEIVTGEVVNQKAETTFLYCGDIDFGIDSMKVK